MIIVAPSIEQGEIAAEKLECSRTPRIISTQGARGLPDGLYPMPEEVHYAPGWELGKYAPRVLTQLQRAYAKRLRPPVAL